MDVGHLVTIVLAAGGALTGAIGIMYKTIMQLNKDRHPYYINTKK